MNKNQSIKNIAERQDLLMSIGYGVAQDLNKFLNVKNILKNENRLVQKVDVIKAYCKMAWLRGRDNGLGAHKGIGRIAHIDYERDKITMNNDVNIILGDTK